MTNVGADRQLILLQKMIDVFDRKVEIPALSSLISAIRSDTHVSPFSNAAIALDANAVLRIPSHPKSVDISDYLSGEHQGPVVLPGQVIQEFWNNQLTAVDTIAKGLQKTYEAFKKEADKIDDDGEGPVSAIKSGLDNFKIDNEALFHPETIRKTLVFLEALIEKAFVPFAPRMALHKFAEQRKKVKTPPGFRDPGDGDFFVWSDLLFGLLSLRDQGRDFDRIILITNDGKIDWCREGKAHPLLFAEARAILDVEFEIWTLEKFAKAVSER